MSKWRAFWTGWARALSFGMDVAADDRLGHPGGMDLTEELARYMANEADHVTDWDKQPAVYRADMIIYAQAAVRFFMDREMPSEVRK